MDILFLHPPWPGKGYGLRSQNRWPRKRGDKSNRYPLLLCYVATLLKNKGHKIHYIDSVIQEFNQKKTIQEIAKISPDLIYIETATSTFNYDKLFINQLKEKYPQIKIIVAGSHVTYDPIVAMRQAKIDVVIKGEQDYTALNLITAFSKNKPLNKIKGICFRKNGKIINNANAELIKDLDNLPFPDRSLIPHQWYIEGHTKKKPFTFVMTSRGCPNKCSYCLWPNVYFKHKVRFRSVENIVDEIEWLIKNYNIKEIFFDDDTFNTSKERVKAICKEIINRNIKILWSCSARVDKIDIEMLNLMKKSGCKLICFGAESASQETLNKIHKGITVEQIKSAVKLTKEVKIITHLNFMFGFPWETEQDIKDTINFALELNPDTVQFSLVFPHPGSKMFYDALEKDWFYKGILGNWKMFDMTHGPVLKTSIDRDKLINLVSKAHARFFLRPSYILKQILKINSFTELKRVIRGAKSVFLGKIWFRGKK